MTPSVYALMLNWNRFDDTVRCVESLKRNVLPPSKILVLDQASPDGSGERLRQFYRHDNQIVVMCNERNKGFAEGVNEGIRQAIQMGAHMVFVVNNDTVVHEECVKYLCDAVISMPLAGVAGPAIMYFSQPEKIWQGGGYFNKFKMGVSVPCKGKMYSEIDKGIKSVGFLTGCGLLIPIETIKKVGFFDAEYFFYVEDADFGLRVKEANLNLYFVPEARMWHKIQDIARDRSTPFVMYNLAKSMVIMMRKRFSGFEKWYGIFLQFTIYSLFRLWQIFKGRNGREAILAWSNGLLDGVRLKLNNG